MNDFQFLYEICSQLIKAQDEEAILVQTLEKLCQRFDAVVGSLWLVNGAKEFGLRRVAFYQSGQKVRDFLPTLDFELSNFVINQRQNLRCCYLKENKHFKTVKDQIRVTSHLLSLKGDLVGVINIWCLKDCTNCYNYNLLLNHLLEDFAYTLYNLKYYSGMQQKRLNRELEIARKMQADLVPKDVSEIKGVSIAARNLVAHEVGGDYVDLFQTHKQNLGIAIGDVMGKGIPAAFWAGILRATLRLAARDDRSPHFVITDINQTLFDDLSRQEIFLTLLYAWYDPNQKTLLFSNAGHYNPILIRNKSGKHQMMRLNGPFIGGKKDFEYKCTGVRLQTGDVMVFFTDGLIEATNAQKEPFGFNRLVEIIRNNLFYSATEILDNVYLHIGQHIGDYQQTDDMSCIVMKVEN